MRRSATTQYEKQVSSDGGNLVNVLHTLYTDDREFREQIDDGMRAAFGLEFQELKFPPAATQQIELAVQWKSSKKPHVAADLSDGTLRYLLLLTTLAHPQPPSLIAIDEPETGLHPSMLALVAEYAAAAAERTQVILTSHSPEFLDAFTDLEPCVTVCQWEEGETILYPLVPDELRIWLERYRLGELFTSGDLDLISLPPVEHSAELDAKLRASPRRVTPDVGGGMAAYRRRTRRIALLVEGETERGDARQKTLPVFFHNWLDPQLPAQRRVGIVPVRFQGVSDFLDKVGRETESTIDLGKADAVFGLIDLYGLPRDRIDLSIYGSVHEKIAAARATVLELVPARIRPQFHQHFAVHEVEAWMLAYPDRWPAQVRDRIRARDPESVNFNEPPAQFLKRILGRYKKVVAQRTCFRS